MLEVNPWRTFVNGGRESLTLMARVLLHVIDKKCGSFGACKLSKVLGSSQLAHCKGIRNSVTNNVTATRLERDASRSRSVSLSFQELRQRNK